MGFTAAGISPTTVTTTQQMPLGFQLTVPNGDNGPQVWVYVFNDHAAFAVGNVITMDVSEASGDHNRYHAVKAPAMEEGTPAFSVLGVAQHAIAGGSYGFILKQGVGEVLAGAGTIPERSATGAGTICVDDAGDASGEAMGSATLVDGNIKYNCDIGFSLENDAVADGSLATCYINCQ